MCSASHQYPQVERFGKPTWRRLVEAVEDKVGGNSRALAQKIARDHSGMQPHTKSRKIITVLSLHSRVNFRVVRGDSRLPPP